MHGILIALSIFMGILVLAYPAKLDYIAEFVPQSSLVANNNDNISDRISEISNNLKETSDELAKIQQELESRIEFVEGLQKEAEIAENMLSLSEEQVNAIQIKLNQELNASNSKNTFTNIFISTFFFLLGLIVPKVINTFKHKKDENSNKNLNLNKYSKEELLSIFEEALNNYDEKDY